MKHGLVHWDIDQSLLVRERVKIIDPDFGEPGWCWNSSVAVVMIMGDVATYVEGWLHNSNPRSSLAKYPHAWVEIEKGVILDTTSGATMDKFVDAIGASAYVHYEEVARWSYRELSALIEKEEPTPPLTPEFKEWKLGGVHD